MTWYDCPDRSLSTDGLALEAQRTGWRLERLVPGSAVSLPGQPTSAIDASPHLAGLTHPIPATLAPIAVFEGRRTTYTVATPTGLVVLAIVVGAVLGQPLARVSMMGPDDAVRDLALGLTEDVRLGVPSASLAAEALAIVDGHPLAPRRLGPPRPALAQDVPTAFARVLGHLTDVLLYFAPSAARDGPDTEPVHQMRVAVRRARSAIAVFGPALSCPALIAADNALQALGAVLAPARDWDVFVTETLASVAAAFPGDARLRRLTVASEQRRAECHAALHAWLAGREFRRTGIFLAWLAASEGWQPPPGSAETDATALTTQEFAAIVLQRRWKKLLAEGKSIEDLDAPALHRLRLRAKRARYAMEIFIPGANAKPAQRLIRRLGVLQDRLGVFNDGAVAAERLLALGGVSGRHAYAAGLVLGFLAAEAAGIRPRILRSWVKFRRGVPFWA